jgi:steroid delta-isomerase-like uncharacterized protein
MHKPKGMYYRVSSEIYQSHNTTTNEIRRRYLTMFSRSSNIFIVSIILIAFSGVLQATAATEDEMMATWQAMVDSLNAHNEDYLALLTDDIITDVYAVPPPLVGKEAVAAYFGALYQGFPDIHWDTQRVLVSPEAVVVQYLVTGTHQGVFNEIPPTGNAIQMPIFEIFEFEADKIKKITCVFDNVSMMVQLGLMPTPEPRELVPPFTLPDAEATGLAPLEAAENSVSVWNSHDLADLAKLVHPDANLASLGVPVDRDASIASQELLILGYSDIHQEIVRLIDMGDGWVVNEGVVTGTNDGPYFGIPATGNSIDIRGAFLARYDSDGLVTNQYSYWDSLTTLMQLGLIPPPAEAPPEGYDNVFFMSLEEGLNMISLPLKPITPYTARSFAEEIGATVVIKLDEARQRFAGFTLDAPDDGFAIEGGKGYIVNVPESRDVAFTGAAWTNEPPVEAAPILAPTDGIREHGCEADVTWAFVVSGRFVDDSTDSHKKDGYIVTVRNTRTNAVATDVVRSGYFAAAFADLNRKDVVQIGDRLEIQVRDRAGEIASDILSYRKTKSSVSVANTVTAEAIRQAFLPITLKDVEIPRQSLLLQNYPNPFNPETWIPYQLREPAEVMIRVYNAKGSLVRTLDLGQREAGFYLGRTQAAYWDGQNDSGEKVASGIYFYQIKAGDFDAMRRMVIVK